VVNKKTLRQQVATTNHFDQGLTGSRMKNPMIVAIRLDLALPSGAHRECL